MPVQLRYMDYAKRANWQFSLLHLSSFREVHY